MTTQVGFAGLRVAALESRMADEMKRLIERHGGQAFVTPSMEEIPLQDHHELLAFGEQLLDGGVDLLILLTGVGTRTMIELLQERYGPTEVVNALRHTGLVARGPKPRAALRDVGLTPDLEVPEPNTWKDILDTLDRERPVAGLRIAVQEYGVANPELLDGLKRRGAHVTRVPIYRWTLPRDVTPLVQVLDAITAGHMDVLLITNAVQVDHAMQLLSTPLRQESFRASLARMVVGSIGPTATDRLQNYSLPIDLEPSHPKMGILVKETAERSQALLQKKRL